MLKTCKMFLVIANSGHNLQGGNMPSFTSLRPGTSKSKGEALHGSHFEAIFKMYSC